MKAVQARSVALPVEEARAAMIKAGLDLRPWAPASTLDALCSGGSSGFGWSHAGLLSKCMEAYRLAEISRLELPRWEDPTGTKLHALPFGILFHWLLEAHYSGIDGLPYMRAMQGVPLGARDQLETMMLLYRRKYQREPFEVISTECRIEVPIHGIGLMKNGLVSMRRPQPYSVRYDTIIRYPDSGAIYSLEHKTAAAIRGTTSAEWYTNSSIHGQVWAWNRHPISKILGPMAGVLMNITTKETTPEFGRMPLYITRQQLMMHERNLRYWMAWRNQLLQDVGPDQIWPQNNTSCWSRYGPCEFLNVCHTGVAAQLRVKPKPVEEDPQKPLDELLRASIDTLTTQTSRTPLK